MVLDFWLTDENSGLSGVWGLPLYIKLNLRLETESLIETQVMEGDGRGMGRRAAIWPQLDQTLGGPLA